MEQLYKAPNGCTNYSSKLETRNVAWQFHVFLSSNIKRCNKAYVLASPLPNMACFEEGLLGVCLSS